MFNGLPETDAPDFGMLKNLERYSGFLFLHISEQFPIFENSKIILSTPTKNNIFPIILFDVYYAKYYVKHWQDWIYYRSTCL